MCGIAGTWGTRHVEVVAPMLEQLAHRGPDATGMHDVCDSGRAQGRLGHRRLSIVDLKGGDQPLIAHDAALVANGEIYNALELREQLSARRTFTTRSDNEVILHLLAEHGSNAVERLNGMFAFALAKGDELLLGRDRLGIKPLYAGTLDGDLIFSSELHAFPAGSTHVTAIPPGTLWSSRLGAYRYWQVPDPEPVAGDLRAHAARVRAALEQAVVRRLMSDVPVGAFLSGGLDSSAIVALLRQHVAELHTFSVGMAGSPDLAAARLVSEHVGTIHHEYVLQPEEILTHLPDIVRALESFDQDLVRSAVPTYFTARLAAQHVKVVMTGEGADELFAGYAYQKAIRDDADLHADARRSLAQLHHVNLQRVDRLTMLHSLEARVPFLDVDLIETALSIPIEHRRPSTGGLEKTVLRMALEDLLPSQVLWRDKAQFDEGSGSAQLLPELAVAANIDSDAVRGAHPELLLRSAEECWYLDLLLESTPEPRLLLDNVARWSQR